MHQIEQKPQQNKHKQRLARNGRGYDLFTGKVQPFLIGGTWNPTGSFTESSIILVRWPGCLLYVGTHLLETELQGRFSFHAGCGMLWVSCFCHKRSQNASPLVGAHGEQLLPPLEFSRPFPPISSPSQLLLFPLPACWLDFLCIPLEPGLFFYFSLVYIQIKAN